MCSQSDPSSPDQEPASLPVEEEVTLEVNLEVNASSNGPKEVDTLFDDDPEDLFAGGTSASPLAHSLTHSLTHSLVHSHNIGFDLTRAVK